MRAASILLTASLALFANAQTTTEDSQQSTPTDPVTAELIRCLAACDPADVNCRAACTPVPHPNEKNANDTINCIAACDLGSGSEEDNLAYQVCQTGCIEENFFTPSAGTPEPTGGAGDSNDDNSNNDDGDDNNDDGNNNNDDDGDDSNNNGTGTEGNQETGTEDGSGPNETGGAAALKGSLVGVVGLVAAVLAL